MRRTKFMRRRANFEKQVGGWKKDRRLGRARLKDMMISNYGVPKRGAQVGRRWMI